MKLSEAMRIGTMAVAALRGPIFERNADGRICGACAIGTPLFAVLGEDAYVVQGDMGRDAVAHVRELMRRFWPWTENPVRHPKYGIDLDVVSTLINLYESHKWSREQVADWIATVEPKEQSSLPTPSQEPDAVACHVGITPDVHARV